MEYSTSSRLAIAFVATVLLAFGSQAMAGAVLSTSRASIGINNEGDLIFQGVGLRYVPTGGEALAPGCPCEGWGVADTITGRFGKAGRSFGLQFVQVMSFTSDGDSARSVVNAANGLFRVTHEFEPSNSENLFRVLVTIQNTSPNTVRLRYRRAMDWDVPPTTFSEMVTIVTNGASNVIFSSDNGFADGNPLQAAGSIRFVGEAIDNGPADHGAVFDFDFGDLAPTQEKSFAIYYGASRNEEEALNALAAVGAEVYSLGKPNPSHPIVEPDGTPNTFIFGFGGVGGRPIIRPLPDYTLGGLRVIDNGSGQALSVQTRIGNAGHTDSAIAPAVAVNFYDGDPTRGGTLLGSRTVESLAPGAFTDITLTGIPNVTRGAVFALVDPTRAIAECREGNNSQQVPFSSVTAQGTIATSTDRLVYSGVETAQLAGNILNTGFFPYRLNGQLIVEDDNGAVVQQFPVQSLGELPSGSQSSITAEWNTSGVLAGSYRLHGLLTDEAGRVVNEAVWNFSIDHDYAASPAAIVRVSTDRARYHVNDNVGLERLARNVTSNVNIADATLELAVRDPDGTPIHVENTAIANLLPAQIVERTSTLPLRGAPSGQYEARVTLVGTGGFAFASAVASFEVVNDLSLAVAGTVAAQAPEVFRGQAQLCTFTVNNTGTQALSGLETRHVVVGVEDQQLRYSVIRLVDAAPGESAVSIDSIATAGYPLAAHACVLQANINGEWRDLSHATFNVVPPPIIIDAQLETGDRGRLLVLVDAPRAGDATDPFGPSQAPDLNVQRTHLESVLDRGGWSYTIVDTAAAFEREFNTGGYEAYVVLAEELKLPEALQDRVVDAVEAGAGLVVAGNHDNRNGRLHTALGIQSTGKHLDVASLIVWQSPVMAAAEENFVIVAPPESIRIEGASVIAEYRLVTPRPNEAAPAAATSYEYGAGRGIYASFDLPLQGAAAGDDSLFADFLLAALAYVHPEQLAARPNGVLPFKLTLTNQGLPTAGRVLVTLPDQTVPVDANGGTVRPDGTIERPFSLAADAAVEWTWWVRLPPVPGDITVRVLIQTGSAPDFVDYGEEQITIRVAPVSQ